MTFTPSGHRPFNDAQFSEGSTSVATSPVPAIIVSSASGLLHKLWAAVVGTFTGTITFAVTVTSNGVTSSDIAGGAFTLAAGSGSRSVSFDLTKVGASAVVLNEGDIVTITPSGGTGASIPGSFTAVVRES